MKTFTDLASAQSQAKLDGRAHFYHVTVDGTVVYVMQIHDVGDLLRVQDPDAVVLVATMSTSTGRATW